MNAAILPRSSFLLGLVMLAACPAGDDGETGAQDTGADTGSTTADASTSADASSTAGPADATTDESGGVDSTSGGGELSGEEFFLSVCAACHGNEGEGTALGYGIQHPVRDYSTWVVRNGRPAGNPELPGSVMTSYSATAPSDATLEEIWDYLDAFPQPTTGEALYLDYCRNCHGEDAAGGITGVDIREEVYEIFDKVREGEHVGEWTNRAEAMPAFDESRLSDAEVQLIADHVTAL